MIFFSILVFLITNVDCIDLLPGVNDIAAGYDAAKMLSASEQNSKYRIFDLSEQSTTPFKTNVLGKDCTFTSPKLVQVTDISVRKQDTCETIAYDFESFFHSYFRSTSFGVGISVPGVISVAVRYSETLKQIQEAITKNEKAVGVSTIWWGLYSVQLAPTFLLKLDPMFIQSVDYLASEAPNPSNEDHQSYYNQFVATYGTHYVSRIIVGGTAYLYTIMESSFLKTSSYEEKTSQISLMFEFKQYNGQVAHDTAEIWSRIKETFKKSTATLSIFQPPVPSQENKSDWQLWQQRAGDHPVVVNRTLFSLDNLIKNKPTVREHLRKTIEFYLKSGTMPTLAQLNGQTTGRLTSILPKPIGPIEGLDVVGCGYDVLLMESRLCILDQSNFTENEQWSDPYNKTNTYSLPNGWFATNTPESLTIDGSILVTSVDDYFRRTTTVSVTERGGGWFGIGRKRSRKTVTEFYRRFYQDYYNLILRIKQIGWYTLSVGAFPYPKLNSIAQKAFDRLPIHFNTKDLQIWKDFFDLFGTHLAVSSNMGGQVWSEIWYEKCLTYERTQVWIDEQVTEAGWFGTESVEHTADYKQKIDEYFKQHSIISSQLLGGTASIDSSKWEEWIPTIKNQPRPISYRLISLDGILPESDRRNALKEAVDFVLKTAEEEDRTYITQLERLRNPIKTNCSRNEVRTRRAASSPPSTSQPPSQPPSLPDMEKARREYCPYVGYEGQECLGTKITSRAFAAENATRLPIGVGMTIDITTGRLLLPAVENTYLGNNPWTDPVTNVVYSAPRGVIFPEISARDNDPVVRVFYTAAELSNEWKYEKLKGSWLGGEFGHSKSLLDIYSKFFSKNQATAITQKPTVLYRLRIENLQLNKYAKAAIGNLPAVYNEALYKDFIATWGTHIVRQSVIGGMHEQQVTFKDCVFSFNGAITSDNLNDYLKQDILSQTLGNSFYADRRKISIDHWLGGDVTEKNQTAWIQKLGANPALLKIEEYMPWSDIKEIPVDVRANLKRIIDSLTLAADKVRMNEEDQIAEQRRNGTYLAREGTIGLLNNGMCEIIPATFGSTKDCSEGCPTNARIKINTDFHADRTLWYVRDETTGFIRARTQLDAQTILEGPTVNAGCSVISTPSAITKAVYICVSCDLVKSFANQCAPVCPIYSPLAE